MLCRALRWCRFTRKIIIKIDTHSYDVDDGADLFVDNNIEFDEDAEMLGPVAFKVRLAPSLNNYNKYISINNLVVGSLLIFKNAH